VFYINDNYEGGELYFPDIDVVIKPEMGSLCVFDGSKLLKHGVKTVTKGTRYNSTIFV
jgi:predicted 2-oxoglutarate/Fe(II)-dependent dioxygenase YbiX